MLGSEITIDENSKLKISLDAGENARTNPIKIIFNKNSSAYVSATLDSQIGYETFDLELKDIAASINNKISSIHIESAWFVS